MKRATALRRAFAVGIVALTPVAVLLLGGSDAPAQPRGNPPKTGGAARPPPPKKPPTTPDAGAPAPTASTPAASPTAASVGAKDTSDAGAVAITKQGDGGQTIRFGELEIEGRLKSPQLVYFLRRVRAEFAAGDLGHRSFMGELSETRKDPSF